MCKAYPSAECNSFIENTKVQGLFMYRKKLEDIKGLFPRKLRMKSLSYTENTELTQAISAGYYVQKNCTSEMKRSTKSLMRLA